MQIRRLHLRLHFLVSYFGSSRAYGARNLMMLTNLSLSLQHLGREYVEVKAAAPAEHPPFKDIIKVR